MHPLSPQLQKFSVWKFKEAPTVHSNIRASRSTAITDGVIPSMCSYSNRRISNSHQNTWNVAGHRNHVVLALLSDAKHEGE